MKKLALICAALGVFALLATGCSGRSADKDESTNRPAIEIQDGAQKYDSFQFNCPVCGEPGIKGEFYADVNGKRIYFDKKECAEKFKGDSEKYLKKYQEMKRSPGGDRSRENSSGGDGS